MKKQNIPQGFSAFTWALAGFCTPILLWPLALLISPNLLKNPNLTETQVSLMSIFLWGYPLALAIIARLLYKRHQHQKKSAKILLIISAVIFYLILIYVAMVGFN